MTHEEKRNHTVNAKKPKGAIERCVTTSLHKALAHHSKPVAQHLSICLRYAVKQISEMVPLASMLVTHYILSEMEKPGFTVLTPRINAQNFWSNCLKMCSTLNGKMGGADNAKNDDECKSMKQNLRNSHAAIFPKNFTFPKSDFMPHIIECAATQMLTGFKNHYVLNYDKRQLRVIGIQLTNLFTSRNLKLSKSLKNVLTQYIFKSINGFTYTPQKIQIPLELQALLDTIIDEHLQQLHPFLNTLKEKMKNQPKKEKRMKEETEEKTMKEETEEKTMKEEKKGDEVTSVKKRKNDKFSSDTAKKVKKNNITKNSKKNIDKNIENTKPKKKNNKRKATASNSTKPKRKKRKKKPKKEKITYQPRNKKEIYPESIKNKIHFIIPYFKYLSTHILDKKQFSSVPQAQRSSRFIEISARSIKDLVILFDKIYTPIICNKRDFNLSVKQLLGIPSNNVTAEWYDENDHGLIQKLFQGPKINTNRYRYTWPSTTNGTQIWFHYIDKNNVKEEVLYKSVRKKQKKSKTDAEKIQVNIDEKNNGVYNHDVDHLVNLPLAKTIISVDPGHVNVITAVRSRYIPKDITYKAPPANRILSKRKEEKKKYHTEQKSKHEEKHESKEKSPSRQERIGSKRYKLRQARERKLQKANESVYILSNQRYHDLTGHNFAKQKRLFWRKQAELESIDARMGETITLPDDSFIKTRKITWNIQEYERYIKVVIDNWRKLMDYAFEPKHNKLRFQTYQTKQGAFIQIARELVGSGLLSENVLLWGDGSFQPTFKGHQAVPNKGLYMQLARYLPVVITSEYNTSKYSNCCMEEVVHPNVPRHDENLKEYLQAARGLSVCPKCKTLWNRDVSAAKFIGKAFVEHVKTGKWINRGLKDTDMELKAEEEMKGVIENIQNDQGMVSNPAH